MSLVSRGKITPLALAIVIVVGAMAYIAFAGANPCIINAGSMGDLSGDRPLHEVGSDCPAPPPTERLIPATEQQCTELNVAWEEWSSSPQGIFDDVDRPTVLYYWEPGAWSQNHDIDMCYMIELGADERVRVPILQVMYISESGWTWTGEYTFGAAECETSYFYGRDIGEEMVPPDDDAIVYLEPANIVWSEWYVCSTGTDTRKGSVVGFDID